jgi:hypothetical protein
MVVSSYLDLDQKWSRSAHTGDILGLKLGKRVRLMVGGKRLPMVGGKRLPILANILANILLH